MAERRMFSKTIIDSDAFLDMPLSTQALYFHLSMRADDDGFVNNAKKIQRMLGCNDDDLRVLLSKNFVIPFEEGVCVIKHWKIHNYIQKDRYKPTVYAELKEKLSIKNNDVYSMDTKCIQDVYKMDTQVRLGKVRLAKSNNIYTDDFLEFWSAYPKKVGKDKAFQIWNKKKPNVDDVLKTLTWQKDSDSWRKGYIPNPEKYLNDGRWKDEISMINDEAPF